MRTRTRPLKEVTTLTELLRLEGYEPGTPAYLSTHARQCDQAAARESSCDSCGAAGLSYRPWHRGTSYRALAVCSRCGWATEF